MSFVAIIVLAVVWAILLFFIYDIGAAIVRRIPIRRWFPFIVLIGNTIVLGSAVAAALLRAAGHDAAVETIGESLLALGGTALLAVRLFGGFLWWDWISRPRQPRARVFPERHRVP